MMPTQIESEANADVARPAQNPASSQGAPHPPTFDHTNYSDSDLPEHLQFWIDSLEAYCEAYYGHNGPPGPLEVAANQQWLRLVRLAVALPTQQALRARIPYLKDPALTYLGVRDHIQEHFGTLTSEYGNINTFLTTSQKPGESFASFFDRLCVAASRSGFSCSTCRDHIARHQAIRGTSSQAIRATALQNKWSFQEFRLRANDIEVSSQAARNQLGNARGVMLLEDAHEEIQSAQVARIAGPYSQSNQRGRGQRSRGTRDQQPTGPRAGRSCHWCGTLHAYGQHNCPAANATCERCHKLGHFQAICQSRGQRPSRPSGSAIRQIQEEIATPFQDPDSTAYYDIFVFELNQQSQGLSKPSGADILIGHYTVTAIVDTGAQANVVPLRLLHPNLRAAIGPTTISIRPFGSDSIVPKGVLNASTEWKARKVTAKWIVLDDASLHRRIEPIISKSLAMQMGMIQLHPDLVKYEPYNANTHRQNKPKYLFYSASTQKEPNIAPAPRSAPTPTTINWLNHPKYRSCFVGLGVMKDYKVKLYLKPNAKPFIAPVRHSPIYLQGEVDKAVKSMFNDDVIEKHIGPADWVSNLAVVFKDNGSLRVTVDLRGVNAELRDTHVPIPTPESIRARLVGCTIFSKLDFTQSFHQLTLDEESRNLTVFRSGGQLYRYKRMSMGLKPASGELAAACFRAFGDIKNVHTIHDDVIVAAPTREAHYQALEQFLDRVQKLGMTLNPEKCLMGEKQVAFWGVLVSAQGISPDPEKISSLKQAPSPQNKYELNSFLCMARSNQDFIPSFAARTAALRELTKKHTHFKWTTKHEEEFTDIRNSMVKSMALAFFNPLLHTHIFVDAHAKGLSAILAQGQPPLCGITRSNCL